MLEDRFVLKTCKPNTAECCRYLMMSPDGWMCGKPDPQLKKMFDDRVANNSMRATGDNCKGVL